MEYKTEDEQRERERRERLKQSIGISAIEENKLKFQRSQVQSPNSKRGIGIKPSFVKR